MSVCVNLASPLCQTPRLQHHVIDRRNNARPYAAAPTIVFVLPRESYVRPKTALLHPKTCCTRRWIEDVTDRARSSTDVSTTLLSKRRACGAYAGLRRKRVDTRTSSYMLGAPCVAYEFRDSARRTAKVLHDIVCAARVIESVKSMRRCYTRRVGGGLIPKDIRRTSPSYKSALETHARHGRNFSRAIGSQRYSRASPQSHKRKLFT